MSTSASTLAVGSRSTSAARLWNAPITLLVRSLAPALAAGCSVVLKPAHQTALAHDLALECLVGDPRLPKGVVNFVAGSGGGFGGGHHNFYGGGGSVGGPLINRRVQAIAIYVRR